MSKSYYASKISDNIARTPEGFLICFNVPIARTGEYKYLGTEVGLNTNDIVSVYRNDDEVFDKKAIASFEGKAFTDEHPLDEVTSNNWSVYAKGEITNVRRGSGADDNCLVADIIVRDPVVISEIESGSKREISSGYTCEYEEKDGLLLQKNIRGNHVALVKQGRAGGQVSIKDSDSIKKNRNSKINKVMMKVIDAMYKGFEIAAPKPDGGKGMHVNNVLIKKNGKLVSSADNEREAKTIIDEMVSKVHYIAMYVNKDDKTETYHFATEAIYSKKEAFEQCKKLLGNKHIFSFCEEK